MLPAFTTEITFTVSFVCLEQQLALQSFCGYYEAMEEIAEVLMNHTRLCMKFDKLNFLDFPPMK